MIKDFAQTPPTRSWRDIPQPVKPHTMSRGGRWRLLLAGGRTLAVITFVLVVAWGGWKLTQALQENPNRMPAAAKAVPVRPPELKTSGVLSPAWLARTLRVPKSASLMELDLGQLRDRLLADRQVVSAALTRNFPDRLIVAINERSPVARVMTKRAGPPQPLLVARDGVVFGGEGYDPALIERLPWLDGFKLARSGSAFLPIEGMDVVGDLLAKAREADPRVESDHLNRCWRVVSLARLASDRELEVRTARGITVVFSAHGDFFRQLAKLDYMWERLANAPEAPARIDLSLGREVPVMVEVPVSPSTALAPALFRLPPPQSKTSREL